MKRTVDTIINTLEANRALLSERFMVDSIGVFGSYVRNEASDSSDVDILVSFSGPIDYFDFLELEEYLTELLGVKVDLVDRDALKPYIGRKIINEVVMV